MNAIGGAAAQPKGLVSLAVERQQTASIAAIKTQAKAEQAVVDMLTQAVQQAPKPSGTPSPVPQRGSTLNILV
jgi:hypothetical protein